MGVCYLAALVLLWAGRRSKISRKVAAVVSAVCLLAGSGALAAAVYPIGNSYGKTVNRLTDLSGNGAGTVSGQCRDYGTVTGRRGAKVCSGERYGGSCRCSIRRIARTEGQSGECQCYFFRNSTRQMDCPDL